MVDLGQKSLASSLLFYVVNSEGKLNFNTLNKKPYALQMSICSAIRFSLIAIIPTNN